MTLEEAKRKLKATGVAPWLLSGPVARTARMEKLEADHAERVGKLRTDADARIEKQRAHKRAMVAESKRHRELLREEGIVRRQQEDRVELTQRRDYRDFLGAIGRPLSAFDEQHLQDELEEQAADPNDPDVVLLRTWLEREAAASVTDLRLCVDPALRNGAASRAGGWVESPPVQSLITGAIGGHELGHRCHAPIENERIVDGEFGKKLSVPAELAAWEWLLARTPVWTAAMHAFMARCLKTYRSYAIDEEAAAMDRLCSSVQLRAVQLRILKER